MFAPKYRLSKQSDFKKILKKGKKAANKLFNVYGLENDLKHFRLAVIVSLKVSKKATSRNKLKRQIRSVFSLNSPKFKENYDIIVNVLPACLNKKFPLIKNELIATFKKINLI